MAGSSRFSEIVRDRAPVVRDGRKTDLRVPGRIEFVATGVDIAFVNGLRRTLIGDLVTAAVAFDPADPDGQDIEFLHNSGVLHNEFIGLRVSLIPLHLTRAELASLRTDGVLLELDVTNDGEQPLDVTSRDIKVSVQGGARGGAARGGLLDRDRVFPPDPVTGRWPLITVLMPHGAAESQAQRLAFRATLSLGCGRENARHSPVAACSVFPVQDAPAIADARAKSKDAASFDAVEAPHIWKSTPDGSQPAAHHVSLETVCGLSPDDLVYMGFEAMATRMRRLAEKLSDPSSEDVVDEEPMPNSPDVAGIKIRGETETAGALIQAFLLGPGPGIPAAPGTITPPAPGPASGNSPPMLQGSCDFCGYFTPHPLQQCIVIRLRSRDPGAPPPRALVRDACLAVSVMAQQLADEWAAAAGTLEPATFGGGDSDENSADDSGADDDYSGADDDDDYSGADDDDSGADDDDIESISSAE
jgi:hypothetical protein